MNSNPKPNETIEEKTKKTTTVQLNRYILRDAEVDENITIISEGKHLNIKYTNEFKEAFSILDKSTNHVFITGKAGTGKSTLMNFFKSCTKKVVATVSFSGLAAVNVGGVTIHSFFKFPIDFLTSKNVRFVDEIAPILKMIDVLVVDEVSMCRADIVDAMDLSLRKHRANSLPFGGVQMVFIGDLYQLPPVMDDQLESLFGLHYQSPYFFDAKVFKDKKYPLISLKKIHRQTDPTFIEILNNIRERVSLTETIIKINKKVDSKPKNLRDNNTVVVCMTNKKAKEINDMFLSKLTTPTISFTAKVNGEFDELSYPTDKVLRLKQGAKIIFIRNDTTFKQYVNGDVGTITRLSPSQITIQKKDGQIILQKAKWEKYKYKKVVDKDKDGKEIEGTERLEKQLVGYFEQYPIKLAWAITCHKSQGQTFDEMIIDFERGCFVSGQAYVALSRCRTLEGMTLKRPMVVQDVIFDERIERYNEVFTENPLEITKEDED